MPSTRSARSGDRATRSSLGGDRESDHELGVEQPSPDSRSTHWSENSETNDDRELGIERPLPESRSTRWSESAECDDREVGIEQPLPESRSTHWTENSETDDRELGIGRPLPDSRSTRWTENSEVDSNNDDRNDDIKAKLSAEPPAGIPPTQISAQALQRNMKWGRAGSMTAGMLPSELSERTTDEHRAEVGALTDPEYIQQANDMEPYEKTNEEKDQDDDGGCELAIETPLPDTESSHWSEEIVGIDMDTIEIKEHVKASAPVEALTENPVSKAQPSNEPLQRSKLTRAMSNAESADGEGTTINSKDIHMMVKQARALSKTSRLGAGSKSAYEAKMSDIGALGIGLQLYFMLTKYLSVAFFLMGIIALPTIFLNYEGNGITSKMVDPLQLAYASLGNEGVNEEIAANPELCLPVGDIDCTWTTVDTHFTADPIKVSWIITISDCVYSIFFIFFYLYYRAKAKQAIETHMNENLTPAKYAVYVRGLPPDATEAEIVHHFNSLYDLTKEEEYFPLWFGCCWGRRRRVKHSKSKKAVNRSVVTNLDHLAGTKSIKKSLYLNTWIAEVSVGHPTGGLLRTFLSMEALTQRIAKKRSLYCTLREEKVKSPSTFTKSDAKLLESTVKKLDKLNDQLEKKKNTIKVFKQAKKKLAKQVGQEAMTGQQLARAKVTAAANAAKSAATNTQRAFDWEACHCAFVVFNNVESRRRCLNDYRLPIWNFARKYQPALLRFRNGTYPLVVLPAPEPSDILWENLDVTARGRFYRRSLTRFVTFLLFLLSAAIISAAQSAQQQFADKEPPTGLCEEKLPQVFYGSSAYTEKNTRWKLVWNEKAACPNGDNFETRYHIAYENRIVNPFNFSNPVKNGHPNRCVEPCVSDESYTECNTLPCFDQDLLDKGETCETYLASHVLYCYCSAALASSIKDFGYIEGPKALWRQYIPCRIFIREFFKKNGYIVMAAGVVILVNLFIKAVLRVFADFERHYSESSKASGIALKIFAAQFLNTAVIVLVVNASLGVSRIPLLKELLNGKYRDFERGWYPTVGVSITTTMLINAFLPHILLSVKMFIISPLKRVWQRRSIRTQDQMNKLYAGPVFDISMRYPMILNSVFVTMIFCGGSPILLFIAAVAAAATYCVDKLSIVYLYSVKTAYNEELGKIAIRLLPWTLVLHLGFSTWMYGNEKLMKATLINMRWVLKFFKLESILNEKPNATNEELYEKLLDKTSAIDLLGKYGLFVKVLRSNVTFIFLFLVGTVLAILLSVVWLRVLWPIVRNFLVLAYRSICLSIFGRSTSPESAEQTRRKRMPVVIPEYTDYFRKSVRSTFRPDKVLGYELDGDGMLICKWREDSRRHGVKRVAGQRMRTWETMQAATRSYAIETNEKYHLAVAEIAAASMALRGTNKRPGVVAPILNGDDEQVGEEDREVLRAVAATDAVDADNPESAVDVARIEK